MNGLRSLKRVSLVASIAVAAVILVVGYLWATRRLWFYLACIAIVVATVCFAWALRQVGWAVVNRLREFYFRALLRAARRIIS